MVEKSAQRVVNYIYNYKPIINYGALFSDGTERFRSPAEPKSGDTVTIRFRTARDNVDYVYLLYNGQRLRMDKTDGDKLFDYYSVTLPPLMERGYYHFEIGSGNVTIYYNKLGIVKDTDRQYAFELIPDFYVPAWAKGAVFYQIFVDRFNNGDPKNDVLSDEYTYIGTNAKKVENWSKTPDAVDVGNFYGGDLQGVIDKLDYLRAGGRCSTLAMLGANLLKIKPSIIVNNNDGSMTLGKKYRGRLDRVLIQYVDEQLAAFDNIRTDKIFVTHAGIGDEYVKLVYDYLASKNIFDEIFITTASCTISSHCGPGTLGILFMTE